VEKQMFVRIDWNLDYESILTAIVNTGITLLSGIGKEKQWTFEVRASEQQDLSDFQTYCRDNDISIELSELHAVSPLKSDREYDLTDGQREALVMAYSNGYFDSPRDAMQDDLAEELGITRQAVSSRLQRGMRRLVASTLITPSESETGV
jgi:predicted DNA binding protein